jgi:hypothetical protein
LTPDSPDCNVRDGGRGPPFEGRDVELPPWVKWLALLGLIIWLVVDPKGLGQLIGDIISGIITAFRSAA